MTESQWNARRRFVRACLEANPRLTGEQVRLLAVDCFGSAGDVEWFRKIVKEEKAQYQALRSLEKAASAGR